MVVPFLSLISADAKSSDLLGAAYDRIPCAILCVRNSMILYANPSAAELLKHPVSALVGANSQDFLRLADGGGLDFESYANAKEPVEILLTRASEPRLLACQLFLSSAPTELRDDWVLALCPMQSSDLVCSPTAEWQPLLDYLLKMNNDAVLLVGADGRILDLNKPAQRVFAIDGETSRGLSVWPLLAPGFIENPDGLTKNTIEKLTKGVANGVSGLGRSALLSRADGRTFHSEIAVTRLPLPQCSAYLIAVRDVSERKRIENRLEHLALYDNLTQLPNRVKILQHLEHLIAQRPQRTIVVISVDVDHFKYVNDFLGHGPGDRLIQAISQRLGSNLEEGDLLGHLGGDDFILLAPTNNPAETIERLTRRVEEVSIRTFLLDQLELYLSLSQGIALYPDHAINPSNLLTAAQAATYEAKEAGRATRVVYSPGVRDRRAGRLAIETDLRQAAVRGELSLEYQPRLNVADGHLLGMEALLRWDHPGMGRIPPSHFIPIAEESGLIVPIGLWVLETACSQACQWVENGFPHLKVAINLSVRQFRDVGLLQKVKDTLTVSRLPPTNLELEITESGLMSDLDRAIDLLEALKKLGITIAIDDFGTGYSSLSYLKRLPIDLLKIDRSFISGISENADDFAICQAVVAMAATLSLGTVAEGVETESQFTSLQQIGCQEVQGYYFSEPLPLSEFSAYLLRHSQLKPP